MAALKASDLPPQANLRDRGMIKERLFAGRSFHRLLFY